MTAQVLLIEDEAALREVMVEALDLAGIKTASAGNGAEAMEYLHASPPPRLILLDLLMPVMDGAQFRIQQRSVPHLRDIPVILLSADRELADKAWTLEVEVYLRKPVEYSELLENIRRYTAQESHGTSR